MNAGECQRRLFTVYVRLNGNTEEVFYHISFIHTVTLESYSTIEVLYVQKGWNIFYRIIFVRMVATEKYFTYCMSLCSLRKRISMKLMVYKTIPLSCSIIIRYACKVYQQTVHCIAQSWSKCIGRAWSFFNILLLK